MFPSSIRALCLLWVNCLSKAKSRSYLCERGGNDWIIFTALPPAASDVPKVETMFTWTGRGLSKLGRLHTAVDSTASPVWKRRILCVVSLLKQTLDSPVQMHAVLFILLLYYFGAGRRSGWGGAGERGRGVAQLKPSIYFCSECSYCFMGFTLGCQTTLACLLPCLTSVHATPGGCMLAPETYKTHPRRREQTWDCAAASCKTKCYCSVKKTAVDMFAICKSTRVVQSLIGGLPHESQPAEAERASNSA